MARSDVDTRRVHDRHGHRGRVDVRGALEELYRERYAAFVRVAAGITRDGALAHEAVQDAFADAVDRADRFRGDGTLEAWVWRIVLARAADSARRRARRREQVLRDDERMADLPDYTPGHGVRRALTRLPERQRLAVFLHYYADLDYAAIADALGIAEGTVAATLHAARASLRRQLEVTDVHF